MNRAGRNRFLDFAKRADQYFLSDDLRDQDAQDLANTRLGLIICLSYGTCILALTPTQLHLWPTNVVAGLFAIGLATLGLPFALRQSNAIRYLGHIVCVHLATFVASIIWISAGEAMGILIVIPLVPVVTLLTQGARATAGWGAIAIGLLAFGAAFELTAAEPVVAYAGPSNLVLYGVSLICTSGMIVVALLFDRFWNSTGHEVARRARAETAKSDERYSSLLEHGSEGILVVDETSRITFANPAAERLVGLNAGQDLGRKLRDFVEPEYFELTTPVWQYVLTTPNAVGRTRIRTRAGVGPNGGGESRILELTLSNHLDNPAVRGIVIHQHDITNLTRAEANYETLVERSLQGIAVMCDGKVVYVNQALADLFGVRREDLLVPADDTSLEYVHRDDREMLRLAFNSTDLNQTDPVIARYLLQPGKWRWIQMLWSDCVWEGRPARQTLYADVTAQKELEARSEREHERLEVRIRERTLELENSQRSLREQERLAAVGTLAAGIAHQINNPIGAILTSADFAMLVEHDEDGERIRSEAFAEIRNQAIRCGKIVRSILQFSRAEPTEKWSSDLGSVLHTVVNVTSRYAKERGATVDIKLSPEASEHSVIMNPIEIEQVFVNLLRNAIESQPDGARVTVATRLKDRFIQITVADDGPGVRVTDETRIFEPFYTTRLREGGSGLGLSVAHGIIKDHAGHMWLENRSDPDGPGARFHVTLPVEKPDS